MELRAEEAAGLSGASQVFKELDSGLEAAKRRASVFGAERCLAGEKLFGHKAELLLRSGPLLLRLSFRHQLIENLLSGLRLQPLLDAFEQLASQLLPELGPFFFSEAFTFLTFCLL